MGENGKKIGILTFHCSDNFGAMLQAYGLKTCLCDRGMDTEIVRYEPCFMTGRHWLIPYVPCPPCGGDKKRKRYIWLIKHMAGGLRANLAKRTFFFKRRRKMRDFREKFLIDKRSRPIYFARGLGRLPHSCFIVGSDQIWNPDITCGLRAAYFGAFQNKHTKKIIAYGASIGGESLAPQYDEEFAELMRSVDAVSVREAAAIPYLKRFYGGKITPVLDPVFFLERETWRRIGKMPEKRKYIFVYLTEKNQELSDYVQNLAAKKGLAAVELYGGLPVQEEFEGVFTAGPAEFLGYIEGADYVVTNSFHAVAFSIIYQKKFLAFLHRERGARIRNIIRIHGLEDRIYQTGKAADIDTEVDWKEVRQRTREGIRASWTFLAENIPGLQKG